MSIGKPVTSRSFLIVSSIVFLGLSLLLATGLPSIWFTLFTTESTGLLHMCWNHLCRDLTIFSTLSAPQLSLSLALSFTSILSFLLPGIMMKKEKKHAWGGIWNLPLSIWTYSNIFENINTIIIMNDSP